MTIYVFASEPSFWEAVRSSAVGGIVAGIVVAVVLAVLQKFRAPLFELRKSDNHRANLKYNGWFPIQLGGNHAHHEGEILTTPTPKAVIAGDYMGQATRKTVAFDRFTPGESVTISFRRRIKPRGNRHGSVSCPDVTTIRNRWFQFFGWKSYQLELTAGD